jgi:hypothetical protein
MGRNKTLRHRVATLKRRVQLHEDKKRRERRKGRPELGLIEHWQAEIDNWRNRSGTSRPGSRDKGDGDDYEEEE